MKFTFALTLLSFVLISACADDGHGHSHEAATTTSSDLEPVSITRFGERSLVFAEFSPLVRGVASHGIVHVTRLVDGSAETGVQVEFVVRGARGAEMRFAAVEKIPGHFAIAPLVADVGEFQSACIVRRADAVETIDLGMVVVVASALELADAKSEAPDPNAVTFLMESQWDVRASFERVEPRRFVNHVSAPARVQLRSGADGHVSVPIAGRLVRSEGHAWPRPGDRVEAGDVLAVVEPVLSPERALAQHAFVLQQHQLRHELDLQRLDAERAQRSALARLETAQREVQRMEGLLAAELGTEQELARVRGDVSLARAEQSSAKNALDSVRSLRDEHGTDPDTREIALPIPAPISGVVVAVEAAIGEFVEPGRDLVRIVDASRVWIEADVAEEDFARIGVTPRGSLRALGLVRRLDDAPIVVSPLVDELSRSVRLAFEIDNTDAALRPGALCEVDFDADAIDGALTVPEAAIVRERGVPLVFVMLSGESFAKRKLVLGPSDGERVRVLSGLEAGDIVVVRGAGDLRLAALSPNAIVGHQH